MPKPKPKDRLPKPAEFNARAQELQALGRRLPRLMEELIAVYEEAYDYGLSANGSGSLAISRSRFSVSDPTGEAFSATRQYETRGACRRSLRDVLRALDALSELENSTVGLTATFLEMDARDLRRRLDARPNRSHAQAQRVAALSSAQART